MNERLKQLLNNTPSGSGFFWRGGAGNIFIYGTGRTAQDIYRILSDQGILIAGFLDHRPSAATHLLGLPILSPDRGRDAIVILGIHNREAEIPPIVKRLEEYGAQRIVSPIELYDDFGDALGNRYWLTKRSYYSSFEAILDEVDRIWADEPSRALYWSLLEFRMTGDYSLLPAPDLSHQYMPPGIPSWKTPLRIVDCGAFDGDTLRSLMQAAIPVQTVAAFEPDAGNFQKLVQFVQGQGATLRNISLWPCGVYSSTVQLHFAPGQGEASSIGPEGASVIQCVSLDDSIPDFAPTLIKMDVEGAEYEALLGARQMINKHHPGLAISAYHRPPHLWQIPLLIKGMTDDAYSYYLRAHAFNDFDVILYAIPR